MSDNESMECDDQANEVAPEVFNPKKHQLEEDEELVMDESAYVVHYVLGADESCLSFDIIQDGLGEGDVRCESFPYTLYAISGSEAGAGYTDYLTVMKLSNISKIEQDDSNDEDSSNEEQFLDDEAEVDSIKIRHNGIVNRVRSQNIDGKTVVASWSDLGRVHIWDISNELLALNDSAFKVEYLEKKDAAKLLQTVTKHAKEGYALDWSGACKGLLASGDNDGKIVITLMKEDHFETMNDKLIGHRSSVEDVQWSPSQPHILMSCSSDRRILVWDTRDMKHHAEIPDAHLMDVNVISWNKKCQFSLVSGGDDGIVKVWDLRMVQSSGTVIPTHLYDYHKECPITSIDWLPGSEYVFACSSEDDQLTIWDISMEQEADEGISDYPVHMLFNHMGQKEIKELHWHPQIPGLMMTTALTGFNVFKTISV